MCVVPLCMVIPSNAAIIVKMIKQRKFRRQFDSNGSGNDSVRVTIMLLSVSIACILLVLSMAILTVLHKASRSDTHYGTVIILSNLPYLNMSVNFYLYFMSGKLFRQQLKQLLKNYLQLCPMFSNNFEREQEQEQISLSNTN